jgi:predicted nuclease of predicted toxin-antitoxin system
MKFLIDQDVYKVTIDFLRGLGHEVITARELGLATASDIDILRAAYERNLILVTRDKGFGALLFLSHMENHGVIRLKIEPKNISEVHEESTNFLRRHGTLDFNDYFVVIEPGRHRIRFCKRET